jgi:hypothetical protein
MKILQQETVIGIGSHVGKLSSTSVCGIDVGKSLTPLTSGESLTI